MKELSLDELIDIYGESSNCPAGPIGRAPPRKLDGTESRGHHRIHRSIAVKLRRVPSSP